MSGSSSVEGLVSALTEVGDALAAGDLERLLRAEPALAIWVAGEPGPVSDPDALARARAALLRCRRLGASLMEVAGASLDPAVPRTYARNGAGASELRGGGLEVKG